MKMTAQQIEALGMELLGIAKVFDPRDAAIISLVVEAGTKLNTVIHDIRNQTDANAQAVWDEVSANYGSAVDAFDKSVAAHTEIVKMKIGTQTKGLSAADKGTKTIKQTFVPYTGNVKATSSTVGKGTRSSPPGQKVTSNLGKKVVMKRPGSVMK